MLVVGATTGYSAAILATLADHVVALEYLIALYDRMFGRIVPVRFVLFSAIGAAGAAVHLGLLALLAARRRPWGVAWILGPALLIAAGIPLYMQGQHTLAVALAALGEGLLLVAALRWLDRNGQANGADRNLASVSALTLMVIVFQALLGMWTVTWLLKPIVVMGHLLGGIDAASLAGEVAVVKNEKLQREGAPYGGVLEAITVALYPRDHPYGHTILGSFEDLDNADLDTVADWHGQWYGASNAILVLAGDISFAEAREKVAHWFGAMPAGVPLRQIRRWVPDIRDTRRIRLFDKVPHVRHEAIWATPPQNDRDAPLLQMIGQILGGGPHSRLGRRLVDQERLCLGVGAYQDSRSVCGEFHVVATLAPGAAQDAVEAIIAEEIAIFIAEGPTQAELDRVRRAERAALERMMDQLGGIAELLAGNMQALGRPDGHRDLVAIAEQASPVDVRDVAAQWLGRQALALDILPFRAAPAAGDTAERSRAPAAGAVHLPRFPATLTATLDNGLELRVAHRPGARAVDVALLFDNGSRQDPKGHEGLSMAAMALADAGTSQRDKHGWSHLFTETGIKFGANALQDAAIMSVSALKGDLGLAMASLAQILLEPLFPADELRMFLDRQIAGARSRGMTPASAADMVIRRLIYGAGHPYTTSAQGTAESLPLLTRDMLVERHREWLDPRRAKLIMVGDLTLDEAREIAGRALGAWRGEATLIRPADGAWAPEPGRYRIERPGNAQSALHLALASPEIRVGNEALALFNTMMGGGLSSRLNLNLREDKGWTYGISSSFSISPLIGSFHIRTEVQADRTRDAVAEIEAELTALSGAKPVTADELETARSAMLIGMPNRWVGNGAVMNAMIEQILFKLPDDHADGLEARIRNVGLTDIEAVVALVGDPARYACLAAGETAQMGGDGFMEIDTDGNRV